ncbi:ATP-binding cassette domain-containing protein [Treponema putidum]|uniref:ATP-binding cassette domain-containing protein n=1 Tax=Treponema putidum TaxID=221027 RepID=UPI002104434E|nr:ATP-binding cassette domain-containing protein [Treponema putidum]UTY30214.1 ATP-binding cassette domain-containing protein [Treponema putidum]
MIKLMSLEQIIYAESLSKKYKMREDYAVEDFSLKLNCGEILGLLGPNGAGKSTIIKMLLGIIKPTSGEVKVFNKNPLKFSYQDKKKLGVFLGGKSNLIYHLPVIETIKLFKTMYKIPNDIYQDNIKKFSNILGCKDFLNNKTATLSLGQKIRAELLCILIYEPSLLILDEPSLGLDIEGKRTLRNILQNLALNKNISIIITTHDILDMQKLCSKIILIANGKKLFEMNRLQLDAYLDKYTSLTTNVELDCKLFDIKKKPMKL